MKYFKSIFLYTILALSMLTGCEKDKESDVAISFSPLAQKSTKTVMLGTTYEDEGFMVSAWRNGTNLYFQNAQVSTKASETNWQSTNFDCYWPISGSLSFTAFSPYSASAKGVLTNSDGSVSCSRYTINNQTDMGTDFCYANATRTDCAADRSPVDMVFHHALSLILVKVATPADYTNTGDDGFKNTVEIAIKSMKIKNIKSSGTFSSKAAEHWSSQADVNDFNITAPDGNSNVGFLMIPQSLNANAAIEVEYTVKQTVSKDGATIREISTDHTGTATIGGAQAKWEENKKITYNLTISPLHPITFNAVYSQPWIKGDEDTYTFI